jgi:hypothetical protein
MQKNKKHGLLFLLLFAIGACQKEYTCECKYSAGSILAKETFVIKDSKKNATVKCLGNSIENVSGVEKTCTLQE